MVCFDPETLQHKDHLEIPKVFPINEKKTHKKKRKRKRKEIKKRNKNKMVYLVVIIRRYNMQ